MFWIVTEDEGLYYYWGECKTIEEAFEEIKTIRKNYPDIFPLVVREGAVELEEEDSWSLRDFC